MPSYTLNAVNVGSFPLGESDKVLTLFSAERGLVRGVAKGARKPGTKIAGRADVLKVNKLLMATGRSLDIITQAEDIASFSGLRSNLERLSYALYYAELTSHFGQGLSDESTTFYEYLCAALAQQAKGEIDPALLCLQFEFRLLDLLGYKPEMNHCVVCRRILNDANVSMFDHDLGGILCENCSYQATKVRRNSVAEASPSYDHDFSSPPSLKTHVTPLVWKGLILASHQSNHTTPTTPHLEANLTRANSQARRLIQTYIEHKAGRKMKSLDLVSTNN